MGVAKAHVQVTKLLLLPTGRSKAFAVSQTVSAHLARKGHACVNLRMDILGMVW